MYKETLYCVVTSDAVLALVTCPLCSEFPEPHATPLLLRMSLEQSTDPQTLNCTSIDTPHLQTAGWPARVSRAVHSLVKLSSKRSLCRISLRKRCTLGEAMQVLEDSYTQ